MTERCGIADILALQEADLPIVRVVVASVDGSTPREAGAAMLVMRDGMTGTIGGGQLEFEAIAHARAMLANVEANTLPWLRDLRTWPLGPSLGQCCGGSVRILFEHYAAPERTVIAESQAPSLILHPTTAGEPLRFLTARQDARDLPLHIARAASDMLSGARPRQAAFIPARKDVGACFIEPTRASAKPLFIYGAGHVGRAIVKAIAELDFAVNWVDVHADRFPHPVPDHATPIVAQYPVAVASAAPDGAYHLVLTYSHALDLAICHTLLAKPDFGFLGLIGSGSKRARFMKRLGEAGIPPATLARLICPIGIGSLQGKEPATIAISVAAQLIERLESERGSGAHDTERTLDESGRISA